MNWQKKIFNEHSATEFEDLSFDVFRYQIKHCEVYSNYVSALERSNPGNLSDIPFLPISFFKSKRIVSNEFKEIQYTFKSSGTMGVRSAHELVDIEIYRTSLEWMYRNYVGDMENQIILALLPNYLEQGDSSLVYMVDYLIKKTNDKNSRFILDNEQEIKNAINKAQMSDKTLVLFGVAYSLLDLCEHNVNLENCIVIETGGMKGKRKELSKEELHSKLKKELNIASLYSEYGMTELLSQAYCKGDFQFETPPWMKIFIRDVFDPFTLIKQNKRGGINVIDLANIYSCSFIATDDIGVCTEYGFEIRGRIDESDLRGCNLLVD